jgi:hypothetical protein
MLPILAAFAILAILFIVLVAGQSDEFKVARTATIAAAPEKVFPHVNDFHNWEGWSPWAKLDPACQNTFSGAAAGKAAGFAWDGNDKVGAGRMTIIESQPSSLILINLEFLRPFKSTNTAEFTFVPRGNQTLLTWTMYGKNNLLIKIIRLFFVCDDMVGRDFEKGLASMKTIVEAAK